MEFIASLLKHRPSLYLPDDIWGILIALSGWLLIAGLVTYIIWHWRRFNHARNGRYWGIFATLLLITPLTALFLGIRLPAPATLTLFELPIDPPGPALIVLSALPWLLAGGLLGPLPSALLAALSGLISAYWETHSLFTPLELALLGVLFSVLIHQRYRTRLFGLVRRPVVAALLLTTLYPVLFFIVTAFYAAGSLAARLDYGITNVLGTTLALGGEMLIAGLFCEVVALAFPSIWGNRAPLEPSPAERSLQTRFISGFIPLIVMLLLTLMIGDWVVAGNAARKILNGRMEEIANMASSNVPYLLGVGQSHLLNIVSDQRLNRDSLTEVRAFLAEDMVQVPYFNQVYLLDKDEKSLTGYENEDFYSSYPSIEEQMGIKQALNGAHNRQIPVEPETGKNAVQMSFITPLLDENNAIRGVIVARTDLNQNPFALPILNSFLSLKDFNGEGILLDEFNRILYHTSAEQVMKTYQGYIPEKAEFFDSTGPDGKRRMVYYLPAEEHSWAVMVSLPAQIVHQVALEIAAPMMVMILLVAILSVLMLGVGLRVVSSSLESLAVQASQISKGQLDNPLQVSGEDEVGQLRRAFEQMRISLKARLDDLSRLLIVTQGVASSLEMEDSIQPVLDAALTSGASAARVVLYPGVMPELERETSGRVAISAGHAGEIYQYLDEQILNLSMQQERLVMSNPARPRILRFPPGVQRPQALIAAGLRHENQYYGTLWVAFDQAHQFSDEEISFIVTLAGQAALAAANARLFMSAEIGRQRLAAILASTPDPVLVTDQQNQLLMSNPAAWRAMGLGVELEVGKPVEQAIAQADLSTLLRATSEEKQSAELLLPDGRVYFATATSVLAEGRRVGRVCILRDITYFKELDALKSEFVSTVSHDLRAPLTLMRGYATMLEMLGELNEKQTGYVRKIIYGVENMSQLVTNLLDLGRIEAGVGLQVEVVQIREVIERVIGVLQLQATQKRLMLEMDISDQMIPVLEADPTLLQQALHNLVENAIKYTDPGGKIQIRVQMQQDRMLFMVSDTGIGISAVDQPRLFEKFYRGAGQASRQRRGSGLGLAIVKSIVERHGGQVWVNSQLGKGSTFYFAVPIKQNVDR